MRIFRTIWICCVAIGFCVNAFSEENTATITFYLDADRTHHKASARSIEMGIKTAFAQINNQIQGRKVVFKTLDHRGNSKRSKLNMDRAFSDPNALLIVAGMHSPPLIKYRDYFNENQMLTLVPWAAGGPITRYPSDQNWIFRLSVDDTKAGYRIVEYAMKTSSCEQPHMLLEQTPWGESNKKTMTRAVQEYSSDAPQTTWFNWGITTESARIKLRSIDSTQADCILFVGNANAGARFAEAMASFEEGSRLPIFSHWGITGGNFHEVIPSSIRVKLKLAFIQTCYSFLTSEHSEQSLQALATAQTLFPEIQQAEDIKAPPGFIHAYDLGLILIEAMGQIKLTSDMSKNRAMLKTALENLNTPVQGLIKRYKRPFSVFSADQNDAHEALGLEDFCMATYGPQDEILVFPPSTDQSDD